METHSFIHHRILCGALLILATSTLTTVVAQTPEPTPTSTQQQQTTKRQPQKEIPADHYDPDDIKVYSDVVVEDREIAVRNKRLLVHFYRPQGEGPKTLAIYACGDGGWRGLAPRTAQQLAHMGLSVAGVDSKVYLREFSALKEPLTIERIARDYQDIATSLRTYTNSPSETKVFVYGWSLGAGFAIAVGSDQTTRSNWAGIISIGLPKQNQLVSGVGGNHANLNSGSSSDVGFRSDQVIGQVSPLPLVMIQSTADTASPPKVGNALFATAKEPKRYVELNASNHRFSGAREGFYSALSDAVSWIRAVNPNGGSTSVAAGLNANKQ